MPDWEQISCASSSVSSPRQLLEWTEQQNYHLKVAPDLQLETDLDAADCSSCIAAAEVVASLKKAPNPNFPEDAKECVSESEINPDASLGRVRKS